MSKRFSHKTVTTEELKKNKQTKNKPLIETKTQKIKKETCKKLPNNLTHFVWFNWEAMSKGVSPLSVLGKGGQ